MSKTSKGRGLPEKWQKNDGNENGVGSSRKHDRMNTGWGFMEKWVELVRLVSGRKMGKTRKGRGLPKKWVKRVRAGAYPKNGRKMVKIKMASDLHENMIE